MAAWLIRVLAHEDKAPIAGARAALAVRLGRHEGCVVLGETDAAGECGLELALPANVARAVTVKAGKAGWKTGTLGVGDPPLQPIVLHLVRGPRIVGRVCGPDGAPVAGAAVELHLRGLPQLERWEWYGATRWPPPATTDVDGRYIVSWFCPDAHAPPQGDALSLTIEHAAFEPWARHGVHALLPRTGTVVLDARLEPRRTRAPSTAPPPVPSAETRAPLRIAVVAGARRRPVSRGIVWLWLSDDERFSFSVPIEPDGRIAERLVPVGTYRVQVNAPGAAVGHAEIRVEASRSGTLHMVRLARGRCVRGRVTDSRGRPVVGCFVQFATVGARVTPHGHATTDSRGEYTLDGVRGLCWFSFLADGFVAVSRVRWIAGWLPWPRRMRVVLPRGCRVQGTVATAHGMAPEGTLVQLHGRGPGAQPLCGHVAWTDADGRFELRDIPAGPAAVTALGDEKQIACVEGGAVEVELRGK